MMRDSAQESEADFDRLVAAPLLESYANARSRTRDAGNAGDAGGSSSVGNSVQVIDDDGTAEKQKIGNPTLLYGGDYRPLGAISECLNVDDIEQVCFQNSIYNPCLCLFQSI